MSTDMKIADAVDTGIIAEQACKVRALYPELFDALDTRDRQIQRALYRIPHPYDPESIVPPQVFEQALMTLRSLDHGINDLCNHGYRSPKER